MRLPLYQSDLGKETAKPSGEFNIMATAGCNRTAAHGGIGLRALFPSVMGGNYRIRSIRTPSSPASITSRVLPCWSAVPFFRPRSEEHKSEPQSLIRISYAVFGLKKKMITQRQRI